MEEEVVVQHLLTALILAASVVTVTWLVLYRLATRLPAGLVRDVAGFLPDTVLLLWVLRRNPEVPRPAKVIAVLAVLWSLGPDAPAFVPRVGPSDKAMIVALALRFVQTRTRYEVLSREWTGDARVLALLTQRPVPDRWSIRSSTVG
jgi:uncharacterized membrane protein YkvA (DUF1232 family)